MYLHTKNEVCKSRCSKVSKPKQDRHAHTHTDRHSEIHYYTTFVDANKVSAGAC